MITITVPEFCGRKEVEVFFSLSRQFIDQWTTGYAKSDTPQMPHLPGPPMQFHTPSVRTWLLKHFQKGGVS